MTEEPKNVSDHAINFIPEKTSAMLCDEFGCKQLYTYSAFEYLKKMRNDQAWALAAQAFAGAMNAQNAGRSTSTTYSTASGSAYGSDGYVYGNAYGTSTTTTYNQAAVNAANQQNNAELGQQAEYYNNLNNAVENGLVKSVTLFPNQEVSGNIMLEHSQGSARKYEIKIVVGNEARTLIFESTPTR